MTLKTTLLAALAAIGTAQAAITVTSGDIYTVNPTATDYGAVRFKDFINAGDGNRGLNLYLQNTSGGLGSATGTDSRARVNGDPLWTVSTPANPNVANNFWFEYRPVAGATDLILSGATDRSSPGFSRVIDDPLNSVNFLSFYIQSNEGAPPTADTITVNLTDLDGNAMSPGSLSFGAPPAGNAKWYITDPTLLANGFILSGNMVFTGGIERTESDKVQIAFGNMTVVPEPSTYLAGALVGVPLLVSGVRKLRQNRANKA